MWAFQRRLWTIIISCCNYQDAFAVSYQNLEAFYIYFCLLKYQSKYLIRRNIRETSRIPEGLNSSYRVEFTNSVAKMYCYLNYKSVGRILIHIIVRVSKWIFSPAEYTQTINSTVFSFLWIVDYYIYLYSDCIQSMVPDHAGNNIVKYKILTKNKTKAILWSNRKAEKIHFRAWGYMV